MATWNLTKWLQCFSMICTIQISIPQTILKTCFFWAMRSAENTKPSSFVLQSHFVFVCWLLWNLVTSLERYWTPRERRVLKNNQWSSTLADHMAPILSKCSAGSRARLALTKKTAFPRVLWGGGVRDSTPFVIPLPHIVISGSLPVLPRLWWVMMKKESRDRRPPKKEDVIILEKQKERKENNSSVSLPLGQQDPLILTPNPPSRFIRLHIA